jgi:hypothetical protein
MPRDSSVKRPPPADISERDLETDVRLDQLHDLPERGAELAVRVLHARRGRVVGGQLAERRDRVEGLAARRSHHVPLRRSVHPLEGRLERRIGHAEAREVRDRQRGRASLERARQRARHRDSAER